MPTKQRAAGSGTTGAIIIAVAALGLGFYAGYVMGAKQQWNIGFSAGAASAKKELAARIGALGAPGQAEDVKTVIGTVVDKGGDTMTIEVPQLVRDPLADPAPTRRTVRLTAGTKITIMEQVPAAKLAGLEEEFRKKQDAYLKEIEAGKQATAPVPPSPLTQLDGTAADIAVGQRVTVSAKEGILRSAAFDAESVSISPAQPSPAEPDATAGTKPTADSTEPNPAPTAGVPPTGASAGTVPGAPQPKPASTTPDTPTTDSATGKK